MLVFVLAASLLYNWRSMCFVGYVPEIFGGGVVVVVIIFYLFIYLFIWKN